jgi:hypothetical protein
MPRILLVLAQQELEMPRLRDANKSMRICSELTWRTTAHAMRKSRATSPSASRREEKRSIATDYAAVVVRTGHATVSSVERSNRLEARSISKPTTCPWSSRSTTSPSVPRASWCPASALARCRGCPSLDNNGVSLGLVLEVRATNTRQALSTASQTAVNTPASSSSG